MEIRDKLDGLLDQLEGELPSMVQKYPDADLGEFWLALAEREVAIATVAGADHADHVRQRLDRMLAAHKILPEKAAPAAENGQAVTKAQSAPIAPDAVPNTAT